MAKLFYRLARVLQKLTQHDNAVHADLQCDSVPTPFDAAMNAFYGAEALYIQACQTGDDWESVWIGYQQAIDACLEILYRFPDSAKARRYIGRAHLISYRPKHAFPYLSRAVELDPSDVEGHYFLGLAEQRLGDFEAAAKACEKAIEIDQDFLPAYIVAGVARRNLGQLPEATDLLFDAVRLDPESPWARCQAAWMFLTIRNPDMAVYHFSEANRLMPSGTGCLSYGGGALFNSVEPRFGLGFAHHEAGRLAETVDALEEAISYIEWEWIFRNHPTLFHESTPYLCKSRLILGQILEIQTDHAKAYGLLGRACGLLGNLSEAVNLLKRSVELAPDDARTQYSLGVGYVVTGQTDKAKRVQAALEQLDIELADYLTEVVRNADCGCA